MKIEYLKDYDNDYGRGRKGIQSHVANQLGKKLIAEGFAKQVEEEAVSLPASTKDEPIRKPEAVELPPDDKTEIDPPAQKENSFLAKIFKL